MAKRCQGFMSGQKSISQSSQCVSQYLNSEIIAVGGKLPCLIAGGEHRVPVKFELVVGSLVL